VLAKLEEPVKELLTRDIDKPYLVGANDRLPKIATANVKKK
jgi:hypothetical protein